MKNLYKIIAQHFSPKDSFTGIAGYLIAENEERVYDFIEDHPSNSFDDYVGWIGSKYDDELFWNPETQENDLTHKEKVIRDCGELKCDEYLNDLYYGQTLVGWELVQENLGQTEINMLLHFKIAVEI